MTSRQRHEEVMEEVSEQLKPILEESEQAIYVYLDDDHKICNKKFASLLGYSSAMEWSEIQESLLDTCVEDDGSRETLVSAYQNAVERFTGSCIDVTWKKKNGNNVKTKLILVPYMYNNHLFALHFVSKD